MDKLLSAVCYSLNSAVFVRKTAERFSLYTDMPDWLVFFLGQSTPGDYALADVFPYLTCFMEDAEQHWQAHQTAPLPSGVWVETDELGNEVPLEATALYLSLIHI
jgi:hypothetical protein